MSKVSSAYVCSMGSKEFNITPNGDIYLCQWFISEGEKYIMGNVTKNSFYNTDLLKKVELLDHKKNPKCTECWARHICKDCPLCIYKKTGDIVYGNSDCEKIKQSSENFLKDLYLLKKDKKLYYSTIKKIKRMKEESLV